MTSTTTLLAAVDLSEEEARSITAQIRDSIQVACQLIAKAYQGRVWLALGYETWDSYLHAEFGAGPLQVPREDRTAMVTSLRDAGMSTRAIAAAAGVDQSTVVRDLRAGDANASPGEAPRATGLDGKQYPRRRPRVDPPVTTDGSAVDDAAVPDVTPKPPAKRGSTRTGTKTYYRRSDVLSRDAVFNVVSALGGFDIGLRDAKATDPAITDGEAARWADDLSTAIRNLRRLAQMLKERPKGPSFAKKGHPTP